MYNSNKHKHIISIKNKMENLLKTCNVLYDKEKVDHLKEWNHKYGKLLYNSYEEYTDLKDTFQTNITTRFREKNMDNWQYIMDDAEMFGPSLDIDFSHVINDELNKLTKHKKTYWCEKMAKQLNLTIQGVGKNEWFVMISKEDINDLLCDMINTTIFGDPENDWIGNGAIYDIIEFKCTICGNFDNIMENGSGNDECFDCA